MSEENIELARQYYDAWNARDVDGARRLVHPDFEFLDPPNLPDTDRYVGKDALHGRIKGFVEAGWDGQVRVTEISGRGRGGRGHLAAEGSKSPRGRRSSGGNRLARLPLRGRKAAPN
jgi:hypothetical protein